MTAIEIGRLREEAYSSVRPTVVKRRLTIVERTDPLSRKRTADMLRKLRMLKAQVKMLKARIDREMRPKRSTE